jgi:hypothetical protein
LIAGYDGRDADGSPIELPAEGLVQNAATAN